MVTVGYGIGLLNAWAVLWSATLLVFNDARGNFGRIEVQKGEVEREADGNVDGVPDGSSTSREESKDQSLKSRDANGHIGQPGKGKVVPTKATYQTLPPTVYHRLDWVLDLVSNFRGLRWKHQLSGLPPPPPSIQKRLADPSLPPPKPASHLTRAELLRRDLPRFLLSCLALDGLKTVTLQDPYFWGLPPSTPSPFPWPVVTRLALSLTFVYTSLLTIFLLAPLVFGVLLGPQYIGQHAWPWLYPSYFGPPSQVWQKGIAGFWGGWWHQLFRYAFEQAGEFVAGGLEWDKKTQRGTILRVFMAFFCSAVLHACASYTTLGDTRPVRGPFVFFMLQPVGIIMQRAVTGWMRKVGLREKMPLGLRYIGNMAVVLAWCLLTGPNISDDFAAAGIWLYEPLPMSPLRGLRGEGWWRWGGTWVKWHSAETWWQSGLAF